MPMLAYKRPATAKMVDAQRDVLLPAHADKFRWDWYRSEARLKDDMQRIWVSAARKVFVDDVMTAAGQLQHDIVGVVPSAVALTANYHHLFEGVADQTAILDVGARGATLVMLSQGHPVHFTVVAESVDELIEQIAEEHAIDCQVVADALSADDQTRAPGAGRDYVSALRPLIEDWSNRLADAYAMALGDVPVEQHPTRCLVVGCGRTTPGLVDALRAALKLDVASLPRLSLDNGQKESAVEAAAAVGAAIGALEPADVRLNLARPAVALVVSSRRKLWVGVLAWLVIVMIGFYLRDVTQTRRLAQLADQIDANVQVGSSLNRRLAIGNFLLQRGPTPLSVLDELSSLTPPSFTIETFKYSHSGECSLEGVAPTTEALNGYQTALLDGRSFGDVNLVHQALTGKKKDKIKFHLVAALAKRADAGPRKQITPAVAGGTIDDDGGVKPDSPGPEPTDESVPEEQPPGEAAAPGQKKVTQPAPTPPTDEAPDNAGQSDGQDEARPPEPRRRSPPIRLRRSERGRRG